MNEEVTTVFAVYGKTNFHPVAIVFMLCMVGLVFWSSRSRSLAAVILVCIFMPAMQRVVVGGLDFSMMRLIIIAAWLRILIRGEYRGFKPTKFDLFFVVWIASLGAFYVFRLGASGIVPRLGTSVDALGVFFLFRILVRTREQAYVVMRHVAWISIALGVFLVYEMMTRNNVFHVFGGASPLSAVRDGRVRARGPFSHPIMVGTYGAGLLPIFIAMFRGRRKDRRLIGISILFSVLITLASGSSGPMMTLVVGVFGWMLWPLRKKMRPILGVMTLLGVFIHLVREKPIWHLIGRLASVTGGTGYHRYRLIDAFFANFSDWALVGTSDTASWGWGLQDTTNYYVRQGVYGGLVTLIVFIAVLVVCFTRLRRTRMVTERAEGPKSVWTLLPWGFSVALAAHCVSFIGASYFGQMELFFFMFLALIPALGRFSRKAAQVAQPNQRPGRSQPSRRVAATAPA